MGAVCRSAGCDDPGVSDASRRGVTFDEALAEMRAHALRMPAEPVPLAELVGRVLAEDVRARGDHPAFTNSAMDGFAVREADAVEGAVLRIVGESRAGTPFSGGIGAGEATRISTGAQMPDGADAVLRKEDAQEEGDGVRVMAAPAAGAHVRRRGEDVRRGQVLIPACQTGAGAG